MAPTRWQPNRSPLLSSVPLPSLATAVRRGLPLRAGMAGRRR